ncbi:MAG: helix-turn-helix domain-containing protein [Blautia sp.]|nr:helix-turn-helix domain-containing protein [Blautia sp.]
MIDLYKNIKKRRTELHLTQSELAEKLGYADKSMIAKIEAGKVDLQRSKIMAFAKALETTPAILMGWTDEEALPPFPNIHPITKQSLPVLGEVACGEPRFMAERIEFYADQLEGIHADFVLIAHGDSMIGARIHDGDLVFIRKQETVENGEIAVVSIGDEATLKRVFYYQEKGLIILKAENSAYEDMIYQGQELNEVHVLGKAVAFQSAVK